MLDDVRSKVVNPYLLSNGHDLVSALSLILEKVCDNQRMGLKGNEIEKILISCNDLSHFMETILYKNVREWQLAHSYPDFWREVTSG